MADRSSPDVCFIAGTLAKGGAEQQLYFMLKSLRLAGLRPHLLCLTEGDFWQPRIEALGVPVTCVGHHPGRLHRLLRICREIARLRPRVIQSAHFYTNAYAALPALLLGLPSIGAVRNDVLSEVAANGRILGPLSLLLPRLIIANSHVGAETATRRRGRRPRVHLVENAVEVQPSSLPRSTSPTPLRLLNVGRLTPQKRQDRFLRLLASLRTALPVQGLLIGGGPLRQALEDQAASLGLSSNELLFLGPLDDVTPHYSQADLLILTSDHEGTPNVVLEAMAAGLPVVSFAVGGVPSLIQNGATGLLCPPGDESALLETTRAALQSPTLRANLAAAALQRVQLNYSLETLQKRLISIYSELI